MEIKEIYSRFLECNRVSTDSRDIKKGDLFVALKGPNFNGNQYAANAIEEGASYAIVDDVNIAGHHQIIQVKDGLTALQELSAYHRSQFDIPVIAITGSNGKTTTKELAHHILSSTFKTTATTGNLNNHIGVPLTLLRIDSQTEVAIIEMGANHIGEIRDYCRWTNPTHGLITNIGKAHLEGFGSVEGVLIAKTELYDHLRSNNGIVMVNEKYDDLLRRSEGIDRMLYGESSEADYQGSLIRANPFVEVAIRKGESTFEVKSNLIGSYNFENIMAAASIGMMMEVDIEAIKRSIGSYVPKNNRSEYIELDSNTILLDAYNANPSSMKEAINNLDAISDANKVAILGDMLELGEQSYSEHAMVIQLLKESNIEHIILVGSEFSKVKDQVNCRHFHNALQLKEWLMANPLRNSYVLIKGSRGIGLEKAIKLQ